MHRLSFLQAKLFWKLYLTYSGLFLVIASLIGTFAYNKFKVSLIEGVELSLLDKTSLLTPYAIDALNGKVDYITHNLFYDLGYKTGSRITVIQPGGKVLADSELHPIYLENHWDRKEVQESITNGYSFTQRFSDSLKKPMFYMSKALRDDQKLLGILRVSISQMRVRSQLADIREAIAKIAVLGVFSALVIGFFIARKVTTPINQMVMVCNAISDGVYDHKVKTFPNDEIGLLGKTLNRMVDKITKQIARISLDKSQLNAILTAFYDGIVAVDYANKVKFCNKAAYDLLNPNISDCRSMPIDEVEGFNILSEIVKIASKHKGLLKEEIIIQRRDEDIILEINASSYQEKETGSSGVIVVLNNVTHIRKLEQVRRDFVANVSHEIKTPLTAIRGYTETLLTGALEDGKMARRFVEKVDLNAKRLISIVQDILSLARIESQEDLPVKTETVDWVPIIHQVMALYEGEIKRKDLQIEMSGLDDSLLVSGDKEAMIQVFDNIVTNAIRYTPSGGKLSVVLGRKDEEGVLRVSDSGIGIPKEDLDRIFERFYRVDKARSRELGGTGLGLSIVKHLISMMKGDIRVESTVNQGTTFSVHLALDQA